MPRTVSLVCLFVCCGVGNLVASEPRVLDHRMQLELVAREPDIVTPVGLTFDQQGRLLVIESHTHFLRKTTPVLDMTVYV